MSRHRGQAEESALQKRLEALNRARELGTGQLPADELQQVLDLLERASARRSLSTDHTVVGIFGPTGSGKSSLLNTLAGAELARVAARRPTTAEPLALVWDRDGSGPLLDWLQVDRRHEMPANSGLVSDAAGHNGSGGLILLDLPDFDSTAGAHRAVVERMSGQVDVLLWVVDPQKYADAALHHGFLKPLAAHGAVTLVALNQIDRLSPAATEQVVRSLQQILSGEGLKDVTVYPVSALTGDGLDALVAAIRSTAERRQAISARLTADVDTLSSRLGAVAGSDRLAEPSQRSKDSLAASLAAAAGAQTVVDAVVRSHRRDARAATGWPVTRWLARLRPDPLRRLNLRRADVDAAVNRTSMPAPGPAQRAAVDGAVRRFAAAAAAGTVEPWHSSIRNAASGSAPALLECFDRAIAQTDLRAGRRSWWWPVVGVLQWLLLAVMVAGVLWLAGLAGLGFLRLDAPPPPQVEGIPLPTLLAVGGAAAGIVLSVLSGVVARLSARLRGRRARRRLVAAFREVSEREVAAPVKAQIGRYNGFREAVQAAQRSR